MISVDKKPRCFLWKDGSKSPAFSKKNRHGDNESLRKQPPESGKSDVIHRSETCFFFLRSHENLGAIDFL